VMGQLMVQIPHGQEDAHLPIVVLEGSGPRSIGRDCLSQLCLDWQAIHRLQDQLVCEVLEKYKAVFEEDLGNLEGVRGRVAGGPWC